MHGARRRSDGRRDSRVSPDRAQVRAYFGEQTLGGVLDEIEHALEAVLAAEVQVGHGRPGVTTAVVAEQGDTGARVRALSSQPLEHGEIVGIHGEHVVEGLEIGRCDLAGPQIADIAAACRRCRTGPRIRRLAHMPIAGTRRVHLDPVGETGCGDAVAKHPVRGRRTADVAQADEEHACPVPLRHVGASSRSTAARSAAVSTPGPGTATAHTSAIGSPRSKARSCSSDSRRSSTPTGAAAKLRRASAR